MSTRVEQNQRRRDQIVNERRRYAVPILGSVLNLCRVHLGEMEPELIAAAWATDSSLSCQNCSAG